MKKLIYFGMGLLLSLSACLLTGCEKKPLDEPAVGGGSADDIRGGIEGVVTDKASGEIISMASVELLPIGLRLMTDAEGQYEFSDVEVGKYNLYVMKTGFADYLSDKIVVQANNITQCNLQLEKLPSQGNDENNNETGEDYAEIEFGMALKMVYVKGGSFYMGTDYDGFSAAKPAHRVTVDGFYIGKYEVTQSQWEKVMGTTIDDQWDGSEAAGRRFAGRGSDYPMYFVTWEEAAAFCKKLSERTGRTYRLPTEAEWEYAARGGQNHDGTDYAGSNDATKVAWCYANSWSTAAKNYQTHPVGKKLPNGLGLYDMSGNVEEYCSDWYGGYYYKNSPSINPQGPESGDSRVVRGGDYGEWGDWVWNGVQAQGCLVWSRGSIYQTTRSNTVGFRVVCEL